MRRKCLVHVVVLISIFSHHLSAADLFRNWNFYPAVSCYNSSGNGTADPACYPIFYEDGEGNSNVYTNFVAALNYCWPVISFFVYKTGHYYVKKWSTETTVGIDDELRVFSDAEYDLRLTLADIITSFDNSIGEDLDRCISDFLIDKLNRFGCETCIDEFVTIVSNEKPDEICKRKDGKKDSKNHEAFLAYAREWGKANDGVHCKRGCQREGHSTLNLAAVVNVDEKSTSWQTQIKHAFFDNWNHPLHWSAIVYGTAVMSVPVAVVPLLDIKNRAGSFIGDAANNSNTVVIPTSYPMVLLQTHLNRDYSKKKSLSLGLIARMMENAGIIEIAGRIIGTMNNGISLPEARGYVKALMLVKWPDSLVRDFRTLAAKKDGVTKSSFNSDLEAALAKIEFSYYDADIEAALNPSLAIAPRQSVEMTDVTNCIDGI